MGPLVASAAGQVLCKRGSAPTFHPNVRLLNTAHSALPHLVGLGFGGFFLEVQELPFSLLS